MIYSQFGEPVNIIQVNSETHVLVQFDDQEIKEYFIVNLKADGGIQEIVSAMETVRGSKEDIS